MSHDPKPIALAHGGTAATTAANARTNLGAASSSAILGAPFAWRWSGNTAADTTARYSRFPDTSPPSVTTEADAASTMPMACTLRNIFVRAQVAGATQGTTYTVFKNGIATAVTVTIAAGATTASAVASVSFAAGDTFSLEEVGVAGITAKPSGVRVTVGVTQV